MAPCMSRTHEWSVRASRTVLIFLFLLGTKAKTWGARSAILWPWIHLSVENKVAAPLPTTEMTATEKKAWTQLWTGMWNICQGRLGSVFFNHSHLMRRAQLRFWRLEIHRPPSSLGRHTLGHATRQWPTLVTMLWKHWRVEMLVLCLS